jgi:methyl-accepting chemotaxis protein
MAEKKREKDETIKRRLTVTFARNTLFTAAIAVVVLIVMVIMSQLYTGVLNDYGYAQGDIGRAMTYFAETRSYTRAIIGYRDEEIVQKSTEAFEENKKLFEESFAEVKKTIGTDEASEKYEQIESKLDAYWTLNDEIIKLGNSNNAEADETSQSMAYNQLVPKYNEINDLLEEIMTIKVTKGDGIEVGMNVTVAVLVVLSEIMIAIAMVVSYRSGNKISNQISDELKQVSERLISFAKGDLISEFPVFDTKDEINSMAVTAGKMAENIQILITDVDNSLAEIAGGNFMVKSLCPERYVGEFKTLNESVENLTAKMKDTLLQIGETSQRVDLGSAQLADSANALAQGAVDQAGAVEELTSTIGDVSAQARESAQRIEDAYKKGLFYKDKAEEGREEVANLVKAMEAISNVSNEIKDIIGEIEDIATQTNLLSLNASIEAARAGDAGKGFAVVADQIGKLASDSANSAVRTRELIQNALDEVEKGNETMKRTNETLQQVVEGIGFLSNVTKDASENSYSQVNTMAEVEKGIEQIAGVVESNSASAEETSATGEELANQATSLKQLTQQFILG